MKRITSKFYKIDKCCEESIKCKCKYCWLKLECQRCVCEVKCRIRWLEETPINRDKRMRREVRELTGERVVVEDGYYVLTRQQYQRAMDSSCKVKYCDAKPGERCFDMDDGMYWDGSVHIERLKK